MMFKQKMTQSLVSRSVFIFIALFFFSSIQQLVFASDPFLAYTQRIIQETQDLKTKAQSFVISDKHIKKLNKHLDAVIKHLKKAQQKLNNNKPGQAKNQFRLSRKSVRAYINRLNKKIRNGHVGYDDGTHLKIDARLLKTHIRQLIRGNTGNSRPVANAGMDQFAITGQAVTLDGSASSDNDGDPLQFLWQIADQPGGSYIELNNLLSATPYFTPYQPGTFTVELVVDDGQLSSAADTVVIQVELNNSVPIADAGVDQKGYIGDRITLDGSASNDPDGNSLSYHWQLDQQPAGSDAVLDISDPVYPGFTADSPGLYQVLLVVSDGQSESNADGVNIFIEQPNTPPVAHSGDDQHVHIQQLVTLDGSASSDVDGDLLNWFWSLSARPEGSQAQLDDENKVKPNFIADKEGQYIAQLIVDDGYTSSQADSVIINAQAPNTLPVADAGIDQSDFTGALITLDGSGSFDADNDPLSYQWSLLSIPSGSQAYLDDPMSIHPGFELDQAGHYIAQLMVNDGQANSAPDEIIISTMNSRPVAHAGQDQTITLGDTITLDGSASSDADQDPLSYHWSIAHQPDGSIASFSEPRQINPVFNADAIGFYVLQLIVSDHTLDSEPVTVTVQIDPVEALSITLDSPADQLFTNQNEISFSGSVSHSALLSLNNSPITLQADLTFNLMTALREGINHFTLIAIDALNIQRTVSRQITRDTILPALPQQNLISISAQDADGNITITGQPGSVEAFARVIISNAATQNQVTTSADEHGGFTVKMPFESGVSYRLLAQDASGNQSGVIDLNTGTGVSLPPDPASVAPPLTPYGNTLQKQATQFLYTGSNPVQTGVNPDDIEARRVAVLRGKVLNRDNTPLSGVTINIKDHPEYGQTLSRADGAFDLVVNGTEQLVVNYQKTDYLPLQRKVKAAWRDFSHLDDVVMLALDSRVTTVDLTSSQAIQVAQGSVQTDSSGSRQATLFFSQGTAATMVLADGSTQALANLAVRATEYTVGDNGPNAMPGPLPPASGYTYAVELSVDQAIDAGAASVVFSQPVNFYVDNFLHFPVGEIVPVGFYDRQKSQWLAEKNGKIIKIISHDNGLAIISLDPSGNIATQAELDALGITLAEQTQLASSYAVGSELWRVPMKHFSPVDLNLPSGPPLDAEPPGDNVEVYNENQPDDPVECPGCIIEAENQVLGERLQVAGTPYSLNYRSNRVPGNKVSRTLKIPLSGATIPPSLKAIDLKITIAGQEFKHRYPAASDQMITWEWDGLDGFGRETHTSQMVTIQIDYVYNLFYYAPDDRIDSSFARFGRVNRTSSGGSSLEIISERVDQDAKITRVWHKNLMGGAHTSKQDGLGFWSLSSHHQYDPVNQTLYLGDGSQRRTTGISNAIVNHVAGSEDALGLPLNFDFGPAGELYMADFGRNQIIKLETNGTFTNVAGDSENWGNTGDGGLAVDATLWGPRAVAISPEGEIYFSSNVNGSPDTIRKIDKNGIITTFMKDSRDSLGVRGSIRGMSFGPEGDLYIIVYLDSRVFKIGTDGTVSIVAGIIRSANFSGDGGPASKAGLEGVRNITVDTNGELYILTRTRVRKVGTDGIITTVAGNGDWKYRGDDYTGDGGLAVEASFSDPKGITIGSQGELYIADGGCFCIRKVSTNGIITTVAGTGVQAGREGPDGLPAAATSFEYPFAVAIGPENKLYISDLNGHHPLKRMSTPLERFSSQDIYVPSEDAQQLYHFDFTGRHLQTLDSTTGIALYTFAYTSSGLLDTISDRDGNITQIQRHSDGTPISIIAPFGQINGLNLDAQGYLTTVTNPANESIQMQYTAEGLMTQLTNRRGYSNKLSYESAGRFVQDTDPLGGGWNITRTEKTDGYSVMMTTGEGRAQTFDVERLSTGERSRTTTASDGTQRTTLTQTDGSELITTRDGTQILKTIGIDPQFGLLSPVPKEITITTPAGLTSTISQTRSAQFPDENDPKIHTSLSHTSLTQMSTINGRSSTRVYNTAERTWTTTTAQGRESISTLDSKGRVVKEQTTGLADTQYSYNAQGQLMSITTGSGSNARTTQINYGADGFLKQLIDPLGQTIAMDRDTIGRVLKQTLNDGREIELGYDHNDNLERITPPGKPVHQFAYNAVDQATQYAPPALSGITTPQTAYSYNLDKELTRITRPDAKDLIFNRDNTTGKLSSITTPEGDYNYTYIPGTGQLASITTPQSNSLSFTYDGMLTLSNTWSGTIAGSIDRVYDNNFRIKSRSINGSHTINYQYDNDDLLTGTGNLLLTPRVDNGLLENTEIETISSHFDYNTFAEPVYYSASYTEPSTTNKTLLYSVNYGTRDASGRIVNMSETIENDIINWHYDYDSAGRLEKVSQNGTVISHYGFDDNGNRLTVNGVSVGIYDDQDRLERYNNTDYTYNDNGDLTSKINTSTGETTTYDYDVFGNLRQVELPDSTQIDYVIDGLNRRIGKQVNGTLVQGFLYKDALNPVAELDGAGNVVSRFVYANKINVPAYMIKGGVSYRIVSDHLGSPRLVVNAATGDIVQRMDFDEYGNVTMDTNPGFQPFGFAGGIYDWDTNLTRFGARDYDPVIGRWTIKDIIGFDGDGSNLYAYVLNNPVNMIDPSGLISFKAKIIAYIAQGNVKGLRSLLPGINNPALRKMIEEGLKKFGSKADDWIGQQCKGSIRREFPSEMLDKTLGQLKNCKTAACKKAWKLLNDNRFQK